MEQRATNANTLHRVEQDGQGFNQRIAVLITKALGTMPCAYVFALLALLGFPGLHATLPQYIQWLSQSFIQLVALSVLAVGQSVLGRKQELQAEATYQDTEKIFADTETIIKQNAEILALLRK